MEVLKLTKEKLIEISEKMDDPKSMEYYYDIALKGQFEADQRLAIVGFLLMLVSYFFRKLFVNTSIAPLTFFSLKNYKEQSEHRRFNELLSMTNYQIALCLNDDEDIPPQPLVEFSEIYAYACLCHGNYFSSLSACQNAIYRDKNTSICNFIKASIADLCYINKTSKAYKIALANYQKSLIDRSDSSEVGINPTIYANVFDDINEHVAFFGPAEKQMCFTLALENFEKTKELIPDWTEEHDFYLRKNLFLNPLSNFDKFVEASFEDLEDLPIEQDAQELFSEIIKDYKMCRNLTFSYYKGINNVGKREMCMVYSYAYSIFDKIAFLLRKVYNLNIPESKIGFTQDGLFDIKIGDTEIRFQDIKNPNIIPLYSIMKAVRSKEKIENALQIGTLHHNELRNKIDHKSISLVNDKELKRNASELLGCARDAILYVFMLLHSFSENMNYDTASAISTTFFRAILKSETSDSAKVNQPNK